MNFQKYIIIFFIILLLIILIFLGVKMYKNNTDKWPPIISNCPDYWTDIPDKPNNGNISIHIPGSRCVGIIGNNTGNILYNKKYSKCLNKDVNGNCLICNSTKGDICKTDSVDFSQSLYTGADGRCEKKMWADNIISWDGITYGYGKHNPCD